MSLSSNRVPRPCAGSGAISLVLVALIVCLATAAGAQRRGETIRVSVSSSGVEGDAASYLGRISRTGRFISFTSRATNLVDGEVTDGRQAVYVHDRQTGVTQRVPQPPQAPFINFSLSSISGNGRLVTLSAAANLEFARTNVYVFDRLTGVHERLSVSVDGTEVLGDSGDASIARKGRFVIFTSSADNLVEDDTNGRLDAFIHDRRKDTLERLSVAPDGSEGNGNSFAVDVSKKGRYVTLGSAATNLVEGDTNGLFEIFLLDRATGVMERIALGPGGVEANGESNDGFLSDDARYVGFSSAASNLVEDDTNGVSDVFVRDRWTAVTQRISVSSTGLEADGASFGASMSKNGRFVVFSSEATNLAEDDTNGALDVFLRDRLTGTTRRISVEVPSAIGADNPGDSLVAFISANGRFMTFQSFSPLLIPADGNFTSDVFLHRRARR